MSLHCPQVVGLPGPVCTRVSAGSAKRAIVLHDMCGTAPETYINQLQSPLPQLCEAGQYPKSVHFIVTDLTAMEVVDITYTTFGLDHVNTNPLPHHLYFDDDKINEQFIHIALFTDVLSPALIQLICCIDLSYGILFPVLAASDLQTDRPYLDISPTLATAVGDCVASDAKPPLNNIEILDRLIAVEQCCFRNQAAIHALDGRVYRVEEEQARQRNRLNRLEAAVEILQGQVAVIPSLLAAIQALQEQIAGIITRCCPVDPDNPPACWHYQILTSTQQQSIPPQQPVWLNPPRRITDTDPPIVTTGPLWKAKLPAGCDWYVDGSVRFALADWCKGKKVRLYIIYCGEDYLIAEYAIPSTGPQMVTVTFDSILVPAGCEDVHLSIEHNDPIAKKIEFMSFKGCAIC